MLTLLVVEPLVIFYFHWCGRQFIGLESGEIKVLCVTADGASTNRNDFGLHHDPRDRTSLYKTINHYALQSRHSSQVYANNVHCGELRTATSRYPFTPPMVH